MDHICIFKIYLRGFLYVLLLFGKQQKKLLRMKNRLDGRKEKVSIPFSSINKSQHVLVIQYVPGTVLISS